MQKIVMPQKPTSRAWRKKHFTNDGIGHIRGYAGLVHTANQISEYIPKCHLFVEPFAGLGRISKVVKADIKILNDKSDYAYAYLQKHIPEAVICQMDWYEFTHRYIDGDVFFFDPVWSEIEYKEGCLERSFCDRSVKEYYEQVLKFVKELTELEKLCFVTGNKNNSYLKKSSLYTILIHARQKIMGGRISTLLASNKPLTRYHQTELQSSEKL